MIFALNFNDYLPNPFCFLSQYLSEVDIPPETLLEVIDNLKEGTLSLDKIIRDLEAGGDENIILNRDDLTSVDVEETYVESTETIRSSEAIVESQPSSEIITLSDDNVSISPKSVTIPIEEAADRILIINPPTENSILPSRDDSVCSNVEGESSASELSSVTVGIESIESATLETNIDVEVPSSPSIETEIVKPPQDLAKSQIQEVDVLNVEDSHLSDGYVTCESISEVGETVESIVDEQEPPVLSKADEVEVESREEAVEETVTIEEETTESVEVATEPETIPEAEPQVVDTDVTDVQIEVKLADEDPVVIDQPPDLVATEEIDECEGTPVKNRQSIRRNEIRSQPEEERRQLETVPEETVCVDEPPQLQPQLPTEMPVDVEKHLQTPEKEVTNDEENDLRSRLSARKQTRKRKSISESTETTPVKASRKVDVTEDLAPLGEKELSITFKDLRDDMDPSLEAEL